MPAKPAGLYEIKDVDVAPQLRVPAAPHYPSELKKAGVNGEASMLFTVRADGTVSDITILRATDTQFGKEASAAMLKWRYEPALLKGRAVDCRVTQLLVFTVVSD